MYRITLDGKWKTHKLTFIDGNEFAQIDTEVAMRSCDFYTEPTKLYLMTGIDLTEITEIALAETTFDWALPQPWAERYQEERGEWPRGVWIYPKGSIFGEFYAQEQIERDFWNKVHQAAREAEKQPLPEWLLAKEEA